MLIENILVTETRDGDERENCIGDRNHYIVFLNGIPMGIASSLKTTKIFVLRHSNANYKVYSSHAKAKEEFRLLMKSNKGGPTDIANIAAAEFWNEFIKGLPEIEI